MVDSETLKAALEGGRYACPVCGSDEESLAAKKSHVRREHPRPKKVRRG